VHLAFLVCGLLLVTGTLAYDWHVHRTEVKAYDGRVAEFERKFPDLAQSYAVRPPRGTTTPNGNGQTQELELTPQKEALRKLFPNGWVNKRTGEHSPDVTPEQVRNTVVGDAPESFQTVFWNARAPELLGILLSFVGIGLLVGVKPGQQKTQQV